MNNVITATNAFTNTGTPVQFFLTYDAFNGTASVGTVSGGATNWIFNQTPVTNTFNEVVPNYLIFQFSTNLTAADARWIAAPSVDWYPRPPPLLTLPQKLSSPLPPR